MKSTDLMEALGDVPEELVRAGLGLPQDTADYTETASPETAAADPEMPPQQERFSVITKIILTAGVLAACIALAVGAVMLIGRLREKPQQKLKRSLSQTALPCRDRKAPPRQSCPSPC